MCKCVLVVITIIFPPLALLCHSGLTESLIVNCVLTIFGYFPGVVHAIYIICCRKEKEYRVATNVQVVSPPQMIPMYQPVQPPPAPIYYSEAPAPPPVYYPDPGQRF
ncbi:hypothetical protein KIN20_028177 [Parelaphostrongylus tenuis]|uniref:Plasma membrane proteolipid 3 n=1 Tax=Parelaphostrongylus tenuis TaxID=148309 RepID=A0AAD5R0V2_PARTN|nr:hypothetical protein KIN20_028177 [Parelaphostrongylus tenuis]